MAIGQKVILVVAALAISLLLGLRTGTTYKLSEVTKLGGPQNGNTTLFLYGNTVLSSEHPSRFAFLLPLGEYKFQAIAAVVLLSGVGLVVLRRSHARAAA